MRATVSLNVAGTSIYDGSDLNPQSADVTFYLDSPADPLNDAPQINIDGQIVGRTTVETVNNPVKAPN